MQTSSAKPALNKTAPANITGARATENVVNTTSPSAPNAVAAAAPLRMQVRNLNFYYGKTHALHSVNLDIATNRVTALIGPSGCGKSTLLRTLNRMHETVRHTRLEG